MHDIDFFPTNQITDNCLLLINPITNNFFIFSWFLSLLVLILAVTLYSFITSSLLWKTVRWLVLKFTTFHSSQNHCRVWIAYCNIAVFFCETVQTVDNMFVWPSLPTLWLHGSIQVQQFDVMSATTAAMHVKALFILVG